MMIGSTGPSEMSLARLLARASLAVDLSRFDAEVVAKTKICLLDFLSCAFEARNHPWSRQAIGIARGNEGGATIIGTSKLSTPGDAAFANAVLGHGLVREDMHAASICHHGVVIWPTLLALSERTPLAGAALLAAAIIGYEAGAQIGRALFTADLARLYPPPALVAPLTPPPPATSRKPPRRPHCEWRANAGNRRTSRPFRYASPRRRLATPAAIPKDLIGMRCKPR